jgi:hypothetical protein
VQYRVPKAENHHERAEECRSLAQIAPERLKADYLKLAAIYDQLARIAEEDSKKIDGSGTG